MPRCWARSSGDGTGEQGWLARTEGTRAVRLTLRGRDGLSRTLGLELAPEEGAGTQARTVA